MLSHSITKRLEGIHTPFYLYDMELLQRTLDAVTAESSARGYKVHYALKANSDRHLLERIRKAGFGVDCVSGNEVRYAIEAGFPASSIVFAGVGKSDNDIAYAVEQGIFALNCESGQELHVINDIAAGLGKIARVALRINPDVDPNTHRYISTGQADSKFGISFGEIEELLPEIPRMKNIEITGLHFHIGSQIREMQVFEYLCRRINNLQYWFLEKGFNLSHINVGGGLGVEYINPENEPIPDFGRYFSIFGDNLKLVGHDVEIHFELGRSIVAQCGELISRVVYVKTNSAGKRVAIIDASMTDLIRPALYQAHHAVENISNAENVGTYTVYGNICESSDTFARDVQLPELSRGNLVSIKSAGAYGAVMASRYNMHDLPGSVYSDMLP